MNNNLNKIFNPKNIAIIGATDKKNSVGAGLMNNLSSFKGKVYPVNPNQDQVFQEKTYNNIKDIKDDIELAIIAVPAKIVPGVVNECAQKKVKGIIIISAGFAESGKAGKKLQKEVLEIIKKNNISLIGPNSLGIINPINKLNASFAPDMPKKGPIAFISQSGALIDSVIDLSSEENYGFSKLISYGNGADIDFSDLLLYLEKDEDTKAIAIYLEGIKKGKGKKFIKTAKKVNKTKPIIILKGGKTKKGNKTIKSHTAALTSSYQVYLSAFKKSNIKVATELEDLFDKAKALAWQPQTKNKVGIIANSGGCNILAVDKCVKLGIKIPKLNSETKEKIQNSKTIHPSTSLKNPLDLIGDALPERYEAALKAMLSQDNINSLIAMQTLQIMTDTEKNAEAIIKAKEKYPEKPIVCSFIGGKMTKPGIDLLEKHKIPNYPTPERAVKALKALIK